MIKKKTFHILLFVILVDNKISVFTQVTEPTSKSHIAENKYSKVLNNLLVGHSASFDCIGDIMPNDTLSTINAGPSNSYTTDSNGFIGIIEGSFVDGRNGAPKKPW